jgi:enoyl-CoA hydratase/carnithine racemase
VLQKVQTGRVLKLTLDRPDKRNALNYELCDALVREIGDASHDPGIGSILLTGSGKSFCAGMDLVEAAEVGVNEAINLVHDRLFTLGARIAKPLIAAVQGAAVGGGTGLVANCHIVVAGVDATFGLPEIRLGLWPFLVYRAVADAVGERRAVELSLTGRTLQAEQAMDLALVTEIAADPEKRAMEVAEMVANFSPTAIQNGLCFVQEVRGQDWESTGRMARRIRDRVLSGQDFQEGVRAFREKRQPRWPSLAS